MGVFDVHHLFSLVSSYTVKHDEVWNVCEKVEKIPCLLVSQLPFQLLLLFISHTMFSQLPTQTGWRDCVTLNVHTAIPQSAAQNQLLLQFFLRPTDT